MMNSSAHKFRQYTNDEIQEDIKNHYYKMRTKQTVDHVKNMHNLFQIRKQNPISIMNAIEKLENWLAETRSVKAQPKDVNSRVQMRYRETDSNIVFETIDKELNQSLLHLGYISK